LKQRLQAFGLHPTEEEIERCFFRKPYASLFADELLHLLGVKELVTVDRDDFEGATLLHDLNEPFPADLQGTFDLVFDGGTLEHIFNYPQALANCMALVRPGGHFVSVTPASGQMGHGFYQISPELFFRVFSEEQGFDLRKIVLWESAKINSSFYGVKDPAKAGARNISPSRPLQMAGLARKLPTAPKVRVVPQQSDYAATWNRHKAAAEKSGQNIKPAGLLTRLRGRLNPYWPGWLRDWRDAFLFRWRWSRSLAIQKTLRTFPRLSDKDIFSERG
jgi:hypothetical protein